MSLTLVRHTRPDVPEGMCYGRTDVALLDTFRDEADAVLKSLPEVCQVVSSPLSRCRKLARRIASAAGLPLHIDGRLTEMDFGAWEGQLWCALPASELDAWANDFMHARPHGGESVAMLKKRVDEAIDDWAAHRQPIAFVTHAGVIKAACASDGSAPRDFSASVGFGGIIALADKPQTGRSNHD